MLPAPLWIDNHEAGVVTSVVHSPALGWIGLGYLKASGESKRRWYNHAARIGQYRRQWRLCRSNLCESKQCGNPAIVCWRQSL